MDINVFFNYKVTHKNKYSYLNEDGDFRDDETINTNVMSGGELMELISRLLHCEDTIDIAEKENRVFVGMFNELSGETADHEIEYEKVEET